MQTLVSCDYIVVSWYREDMSKSPPVVLAQMFEHATHPPCVEASVDGTLNMDSSPLVTARSVLGDLLRT